MHHGDKRFNKMESKQKSMDDLKASLAKVVKTWESGNRIRRPPNAFMCFAQEYRKRLAEEHPNVNNKIISQMLGEKWRNAPPEIQEKYYEQSHCIGLMHARMYPDYCYSPQEARKKKAEKRKKCFKTSPRHRSESPEPGKERHHQNLRNRRMKQAENPPEGVRADTNVEPVAEYVPNNSEHFAHFHNPGYVPNNQEHFACFDDEVATNVAYVHPGNPSDFQTSLSDNKSKLSRKELNTPSKNVGEAPPSFPRAPPSFSRAPPSFPGISSFPGTSIFPGTSPCCGRTEQLNSYFCGASSLPYSHQGLQNPANSYYPYWRAQVHCESEDDNPYAMPHHTSDVYASSPRHSFHQSAVPHSRSSCYGQLNASLRALENPVQNIEESEQPTGEALSAPCSSFKNGMLLNPCYITTRYLPDFSENVPIREIPRCFSQYSNSLESINPEYRGTSAGRSYANSVATQHLTDNSDECPNYGDSSESKLLIDMSSSSDSESDCASVICQAQTYLRNNELPQPTEGPLESLRRFVSSTMQDLEEEDKSVVVSASNPAFNTEMSNVEYEHDNEANSIKQEVQEPLNLCTRTQPLISFGQLVSSAMQSLEMEEKSTDASTSNLALNTKITNTESEHSDEVSTIKQESQEPLNLCTRDQPCISFGQHASSAMQSLEMEEHSINASSANLVQNTKTNIDAKHDDEVSAIKQESQELLNLCTTTHPLINFGQLASSTMQSLEMEERSINASPSYSALYIKITNVEAKHDNKHQN